jgi:hypothetical protein
MISQLQIKNFKSIDQLTIELGRFNVLIGANGCGKTNILEAICLGGAAAANKLDNEYLAPRGIRYATPKEMRSGFDAASLTQPTVLDFTDSNAKKLSVALTESPDNSDKFVWENRTDYPRKLSVELLNELFLRNSKRALSENASRNFVKFLLAAAAIIEFSQLGDFLIYSPDHTAIRRLEDEERTLPLGTDGCGLFRLLQSFTNEELAEVKTHLRMIDWFDDFEMPDNLIPGERRLRIKDQYLAEGLQFFGQRVANEGFLFLLFYLCLFISQQTPKFFAIDNLDSGLNPKLCAYATKTLCALAKTYDKQAIITTHNPSVLDGLNLHDENNRLFVVSRNLDGRTRIRRILPTEQSPSEPPVRLSEAFLRGYLGGLPEHF